MAGLSSNGPTESGRSPDYWLEDATLTDRVEIQTQMLNRSEARRLGSGRLAWTPITPFERSLFKELQRRVHSEVKEELAEYRNDSAFADIRIERCICSRPVITLGESYWDEELMRWANPLHVSCAVEIVDETGAWIILSGEGIERFKSPIIQEVEFKTSKAKTSNHQEIDEPIALLSLYSPAAFNESWERLKKGFSPGAEGSCDDLLETIEEAIAELRESGTQPAAVEIVSFKFSDTVGKARVISSADSYEISCALDQDYLVEVKAVPTVPYRELIEGYDIWCEELGNKLVRPSESMVESEFIEATREKTTIKLTEYLRLALDADKIQARGIEIKLVKPKIIISEIENTISAEIAFLAIISTSDGKYLLLNQSGKVEEFHHPVGLALTPPLSTRSFDFEDLYSGQAYSQALEHAVLALNQNRSEDSELALNIAESIVAISPHPTTELSQLKIRTLTQLEPNEMALNTNLGQFRVTLARQKCLAVEVNAVLSKAQLAEKSAAKPASRPNQSTQTVRPSMLQRFLNYFK